MRYLTVIRHCSAPVATTLALIVALTVSACAGASSGTSSGTSSGASPAATATTPTTPLIYTVDATGNPSVLTSETSHLNALDTQTGKQAWSVQIPGEASFLGAAVLLNGVLYADSSDITGATPTVSGTGHVSAFNPQTGKLLWQHDSPNLNFDALLTDGSTLVALMGPTAGGQTINPVLVGINPSDGSQLWQKPLGNVSGTPYVVVTSGMVVTATQTRINGQKTTLRAFNASTGATAWSVSVAGFIGNLTAGSAGIFAGVNSSTTGTGQVVAYSAQTGAQMWQKRLPGMARSWQQRQGPSMPMRFRPPRPRSSRSIRIPGRSPGKLPFPSQAHKDHSHGRIRRVSSPSLWEHRGKHSRNSARLLATRSGVKRCREMPSHSCSPKMAHSISRSRPSLQDPRQRHSRHSTNKPARSHGQCRYLAISSAYWSKEKEHPTIAWH